MRRDGGAPAGERVRTIGSLRELLEAAS
jgi:hypothetical protein